MTMKNTEMREMNTMFIDDDVVTIATESVSSTVMNVNGEPMKVFMCTDKIIDENNVPEITSSIPFVKGRIPNPNGIFSEIIFGTTETEKKLNHGYINLHHKFFHPYAFEILKSLHSKIDKVCEGESSWVIEEGKLVEITDETDPRYNAENTGLDFIIKNYHKLALDKGDSILHNDKVEFLKSMSDSELFITKFLVIPIFYRDAEDSGTMKSVPKINSRYNKLISQANSLEDGFFGYLSHKTMMTIQNELVELRKYGQQLIEKKNGMLHRFVLGKSVTGGSRAVISVPSLVGCDKPEDCQVNMLTTGLPLSRAIETGYPFIIRWLMNWVEKELHGGPFTIYRLNEKNEMTPHETRLKDHTTIFSQEYLDKRLVRYLRGYGGRFEPVKVMTEDGEETYLLFTGRGHSMSAGNPAAATISNRPLTWCDLIYMAAEDTLSDKHVYCTRYPIEDYYNITPSRVSVLSTIKTMPMIVNGKVYQHYPVINPFESETEVSRSFIETLSISNLHLNGFGADYDGDTLSIKMCYSIEANEEAERKIMSLAHYMTINGDINRSLSNESTLCLYNMTRRVK